MDEGKNEEREDVSYKNEEVKWMIVSSNEKKRASYDDDDAVNCSE